MTANLHEIIEHLSRHEGGALGGSPVVLQVGYVKVPIGANVDQVIKSLRKYAAAHSDDHAVTITVADVRYSLEQVLGWSPTMGDVAILADDMGPAEVTP